EQEFSEQLIRAMSGKWQPEQYQDQFRTRLHDVIKRRMKDKGVVKREDDEPAMAEDATTNVVDFMALLQQSIARKARTPAKQALPKDKDSARKPAKKATKKAAASKSGGAKAAKKSAAKPAARKPSRAA
ncbi:MAG: Ku protein, partial [Gammaproteobacteria bacterium]|nr:Ku protein [Gammaproteobacteria bacterium]